MSFSAGGSDARGVDFNSGNKPFSGDRISGEVTWESDDGIRQLIIRGQVNETLSISFRDLLKYYSGDIEDLENYSAAVVKFRPSKVQDLIKSAEEALSAAQRVSSAFSSQYDPSNSLSNLKRPGTADLNIKLDAFGNQYENVGELPAPFKKSISYVPITLPNIEQVRSRFEGEDIKLHLTVKPKSPVNNAIQEATNAFGGDGKPSATVSIPAEAFVKFVEVDLPLDCLEQHSGIANDLGKVRSMVNSVSVENMVEPVREAIQQNKSLSSFRDPQSVKKDVKKAAQKTLKNNQLEGTFKDGLPKDDVSDLSDQVAIAKHLDTDLADKAMDKINSLEDRIRGAEGLGVEGKCINKFMSQLRSISSKLQEKIDKAISKAVSLSRGVETPDVETSPNLSCADVKKTIRNSVAQMEARADTITQKSKHERTNRSISRLKSDIQSVKSRIRTEVDDKNPCKQDLLSRLTKSREKLDGLQVVTLDCSDVDKQIRNSVQRLESRSNSFSQKPAIKRVQSKENEIVNQADSVIEKVKKNVDDRNPCKGKLIGRAESVKAQVQNVDSIASEKVPCRNAYGGISEAISNKKLRVDSIDSDASEKQVMTIASDIDNLVERVDRNVEREECKKNFTDRLDDINRQLMNKVRGVEQFETEGDVNEAIQSSLETIKSIQEEINTQ